MWEFEPIEIIKTNSTTWVEEELPNIEEYTHLYIETGNESEDLIFTSCLKTIDEMINIYNSEENSIKIYVGNDNATYYTYCYYQNGKIYAKTTNSSFRYISVYALKDNTQIDDGIPNVKEEIIKTNSKTWIETDFPNIEEYTYLYIEPVILSDDSIFMSCLKTTDEMINMYNSEENALIIYVGNHDTTYYTYCYYQNGKIYTKTSASTLRNITVYGLKRDKEIDNEISNLKEEIIKTNSKTWAEADLANIEKYTHLYIESGSDNLEFMSCLKSIDEMMYIHNSEEKALKIYVGNDNATYYTYCYYQNGKIYAKSSNSSLRNITVYGLK